MKNFKKFLTLAAVVIVTAAIAVAGTLAYLTDRDSKVNTFTVGDVKIELTEDFEQGSTLVPGEGITKIPGIKNTGKNDAYVWLEWAIPTKLINYDSATGVTSDNVIHTNHMNYTADNGTAKTITQATVDKGIAAGYFPAGTTAEYIQNGAYWLISKQFENTKKVEIGGVEYTVFTYMYNKALVKDEATLPGIWRVYLDTRVDIDPEGNWYFVENGVATDLGWNTNKDGAPEIYVSAYAVQAEGFKNVEEARDAYNAQWGDKGGVDTPVIAANAGELSKALAAANNDTILVEEDITADAHTVKENTTVDIALQGNTLAGVLTNNGEMNLSGGKVDADYVENTGDATFTNVDMKAGTPTDYATINTANAVAEYNNVNLESDGGGVAAADGAKVVFNSGSVKMTAATTNPRYNFYAEGAGSEIIINGGTFSFTKPTLKRAYIYAGAGTTVTINGGEFGAASTRSGYKEGIKTAVGGTVVIKGGTFGFDPSAWVADGYEAVQNGSIWTVSAK